MNGPIETSDNWDAAEAKIRNAIQVAHPDVVFIDIWVRSGTSWRGDPMVEVWAVYDGKPENLGVPTRPALETRIQDILWDMDFDASPLTHLVAKADAKDWRPEAV